MDEKTTIDSWIVWLLGITALLLPLTPSVSGITALQSLVGLEQVVIMFLLALGWHVIICVHPRLQLNTSVVLWCLVIALSLLLQTFLFSPLGPTPLFWQWVFFLLGLPALVSAWQFYRTKAALIFLVALTLQAQWAVLQFSWQRDLGFYLLGESYIRADVPGVAKFLVMDYKVVRAYGPFSHPNSMATAMVVGLTILAFRHRLLVMNPDRYSRLLRWEWLMGGWIGLALLLSFSRSAYAGAGILVGIVLLRSRKWLTLLWEPRATFLLIALLLFIPLFGWRFMDTESVALHERIQGVSYALNLFSDHTLTGSGVGTYPQLLGNWARVRGVHLEPWQVTYVHVVPLILLVELGTVLSAFLMIGLAHGLRNVPYLLYLLLPLLPAFFLDHFLYTYPVMWFLLALLIASTSTEAEKSR